MKEALIWHTETRLVDALIPYEKNPRTLSDKQRRDLEASITKFNLVEIPAINTDNTVIAGHARLKIMKALGRGQEEIEVRVPKEVLKKHFDKDWKAVQGTIYWTYLGKTVREYFDSITQPLCTRSA